ncbi:MAG: hypothetical protein ACREBS_02220 [Nitrososphaerales archaeon]
MYWSCIIFEAARLGKGITSQFSPDPGAIPQYAWISDKLLKFQELSGASVEPPNITTKTLKAYQIGARYDIEKVNEELGSLLSLAYDAGGSIAQRLAQS